MAASMLSRGAPILTRTIKTLSASKTLLAGNPQNGLLLQAASYNPKPLRLNIREPYIPDPEDEKTPEWQKSARYRRKVFGRYGAASGLDPQALWPSHDELDQMIAEEKKWQPPLEVMVRNIEAREKQEAEKRLAKEKLIAANMAKMPKMIADWRQAKRDAKLKLKEEKARRAKLLSEAKERFGHAVDPRSTKFLEMVAEIEKEEKKKKKLLKRRLKEEQVGAPVPPPS